MGLYIPHTVCTGTSTWYLVRYDTRYRTGYPGSVVNACLNTVRRKGERESTIAAEGSQKRTWRTPNLKIVSRQAVPLRIWGPMIVDRILVYRTVVKRRRQLQSTHIILKLFIILDSIRLHLDLFDSRQLDALIRLRFFLILGYFPPRTILWPTPSNGKTNSEP